MAFFIWKRAGLPGMFAALLPFLLGPEIVARYYYDQFPVYNEAVAAKLFFWGLSIVLTSIVIFIASKVYKEDSQRPFKERLMLDHIYYVPLLLWPILLVVLCACSLYFKWPY